ncbi:DMT family transporter [Leucobacter sp. GX24907]
MLAILAVLLSALCFSTTASSQVLLGVEASPISVGAARVVVGGAILATIAVLRARQSTAARARPHNYRPPHGLPSWLPFVVGTAGVIAYQPAFFAGAAINGVAVGTVVALGSAPVMTGLIMGILERRIPGPRWLIATALALCGMFLVSGLLSGAGAGDVDPIGLLSSVGAGASYACYTIASKRLFDRGWTASTTVGTMYGIAGACSLPLVFVGGAGWLLTPQGALLALWLGAVTTALGYLLFGWGLTQLAPTTVSTLTLAEPLLATLLGLVVLGERLSLGAALGLVIIATGLIVLSFPSRRKAPHVSLA